MRYYNEDGPGPRKAVRGLSFRCSAKSPPVSSFVELRRYGNMVKTYFSLEAKRAETITLIDANFVLRAGCAYVQGTNISQTETANRAASYNPSEAGGIQLAYTAGQFRRSDTGQVVKSAAVIELLPDRSVWAWGLGS